MKTSTTTTDSLGQRLYSLRKHRNLSLQELSEITSISRSNLNRYERDESRPTSEFLKVLCRYYEVSADWLLFGVRKEELQKEASWSSFDPELKAMVNRLATLMTSESPHLRSWTIVQFTNAFQAENRRNPVD